MKSVDRRWGGRVVLSPGRLLYIGQAGAADQHAHHAVQFIWGLDDLVEVTHGGQVCRRRALLIPADEPHAFDAHGKRVVLVLLDAESAESGALVARGHGEEELASVLEGLTTLRPDASPTELVSWWSSVLTRLGIVLGPRRTTPPTRKALRFVEDSLSAMPRLSSAARAAGLSPGRLSHLFAEDVGLPFRRYVLWRRLMLGVETAGRGVSLTEAAVAAGFADSAHFSRTFRANFGLAPSVMATLIEVERDSLLAKKS
jgi:AraC-like DNA-binding protein